MAKDGLLIGKAYIIEYSRTSKYTSGKPMPYDMVCVLKEINDAYVVVSDQNKTDYIIPFSKIENLKCLGEPSWRN